MQARLALAGDFGTRTGIARISVIAAVIALFTAFSVTPAQAATALWQRQIVSSYYEDKCLSTNNATGGNNVYTALCSGVAYHKWTYYSSHELKNGGNGTCLSGNPNGNVYTVPCSGSEYHRWAVSGANPGTLINEETGQCLSTNNADVYLTECTGVVYHKWWRA